MHGYHMAGACDAVNVSTDSQVNSRYGRKCTSFMKHHALVSIEISALRWRAISVFHLGALLVKTVLHRSRSPAPRRR